MEYTEFVLSDEFAVNFSSEILEDTSSDTTRVILAGEERVRSYLAPYGAESEEINFVCNHLEHISFFWSYHGGKKTLIAACKDQKDLYLRNLGVQVVDQLLMLKTKQVDIFVDKDIIVEKAKHFIQSALLWNYKFEMKTRGKTHLLSEFNFKFERPLTNEDLPELDFYKTAVFSTLMVRDMINTRANVATPEYMEKIIRHISSSTDKIPSFNVIQGKELEEQGLEIFYSVGKGAAIDPRLVHFVYKGNPDSEDIEYAIVGKGITFDAGGLNIKLKPEDMYCDKTGACTTAGILKGVIELELKINICFAFAIAENSVDANSYRPSDIYKSYKGLTVEIANTDSEGRLVLIDTFSYIQEQYNPKRIIDLATLTGTTMIALGDKANGLFTNDEEFAKAYITRGKEMHENSWILPIFEEHKQDMISDVSDLMNRGPDTKGHSSRAAAFMLNFINEGTSWLHVDYYGPAHLKSANPPHPKYATGFNTQTVLNLLRKHE
ncbi:unnamed protein product [Moneuplotes crassus]|uniref:Cytosol aminopeptidase domain-containing protein n=1 Tax=Euplotes crassus TaxID=5936 RepID=A0AAD1UL33_EUPCR|nr:unnamed protein product [Moneuplotes crassus]